MLCGIKRRNSDFLEITQEGGYTEPSRAKTSPHENGKMREVFKGHDKRNTLWWVNKLLITVDED